jgi:hypothetical protein
MSMYNRSNNAILKGAAARYRLWPATTGVPAAGISVVSGAGAWGAYADIVAASAITTEFWICGFNITTLGGGAIQVMEMQIASATEVLYEFRFDPSLVTTNVGPFMLPYPMDMPANAQVRYRAGGAAARSLAVSLVYALNLA